MHKSKIDISLVVTFHSEKLLAHLTLNSIERCRKYAESHGISTEYVWVLDNIDQETKEILLDYPIDSSNVTILEVNHGDAGDSRNSGIAATSGEIIGIFDGDDYYSENWIERSIHYLNVYGDNTILHPEYMVSFGEEYSFGRHIDQTENFFSKKGLLTHNFWTSAWSIAKKDTYLRIPYVATNVKKTGYGYEDWHWNCETISSGFIHRLTPKTVGFYRRRPGSRLSIEAENGGIMAPSKLFENLNE